MHAIKQVKKFFKSLNSSIDQKADDFTADFHNRPTTLLLIQIISLLILTGCLMGITILVGIINPAQEGWVFRCLVIFQMTLSPISTIWSIHLFRHAGWHLGQRISDKLVEWFD